MDLKKLIKFKFKFNANSNGILEKDSLGKNNFNDHSKK